MPGAAELQRLTRQFRETRMVDFFDSPRGRDIAMLVRRAAGPARSGKLVSSVVLARCFSALLHLPAIGDHVESHQ
jgi:hypothetical protein